MKAIAAWFRRVWCAVVAGFSLVLGWPDSRDWHVYGGLVIAGVGGWVLSPAWTFIAVGGALVLFGLFGGLLDRWMAQTEDDG